MIPLSDKYEVKVYRTRLWSDKALAKKAKEAEGRGTYAALELTEKQYETAKSLSAVCQVLKEPDVEEEPEEAPEEPEKVSEAPEDEGDDEPEPEDSEEDSSDDE